MCQLQYYTCLYIMFCLYFIWKKKGLPYGKLQQNVMRIKVLRVLIEFDFWQWEDTVKPYLRKNKYRKNTQQEEKCEPHQGLNLRPLAPESVNPATSWRINLNSKAVGSGYAYTGHSAHTYALHTLCDFC